MTHALTASSSRASASASARGRSEATTKCSVASSLHGGPPRAGHSKRGPGRGACAHAASASAAQAATAQARPIHGEHKDGIRACPRPPRGPAEAGGSSNHRYGESSRATPSRSFTGSGAPVHVGERQPSCARAIRCLRERLGARGEVGVVALHVELEVEPEAARVPVGGAEAASRPPSTTMSFVWSNGGGVSHTPAAALEHLPELRGLRPLHERQVPALREDDVHLRRRASPRRRCAVMSPASGRKYGVTIRTRSPRGGERAEEQPAHRLEVLVRTVGDAAGQHRSRRARSGGKNASPSSDSPVVKSQSSANARLEVRDDRPLDARVQVHERQAAARRPEEVVAHVHPAGEADPAVHDEHLAVVAQVDEREPARG